MRRTLILISLMAVMLPLWTAPSWACTCALIGPAGLAHDADVVFAGRVEAIDRGRGSIVATFVPDTLYKGPLRREIAVTTAADGAACGFGFQDGRRYTVFAYRDSGALHTSICSGTTQGDIDPGRFGLGEPRPVPGIDEIVDASEWWPQIWTAAGLALATLIGLILLRKRVRT